MIVRGRSLGGLFALLAVIALIIAACGPAPAAPAATTAPAATAAPAAATAAPAATTAPAATAAPAAATAAPAPAAGGSIRLWTQYDLTKTDSDQSKLLKERIETFEKETGIKVEVEQIAWDQLAPKLALAVTSGGDVPDVVESGSQHIPALLSAGALTEMDDLLKDQAWVSDLNDTDTLACVRDGKRICVSNLVRSSVTYYRTADFPSGFPTTAEAFKTEAERLAKDGRYITSFFANKEFASVELTWGQWIYGNGGRIFDDEGKPAWNDPKVVEVLQFGRDLITAKALPEATLTGDFAAAETPWIDKQAASFRGGTWSFIFVKGLGDEVAAGDVKFTGGLGFNGNSPKAFTNSENWIIPKGAKNTDGAVAWISAFMEPTFLASWSKASFGLPTINAAYDAGDFDNEFYKTVATLIAEQGNFMEQSPYYQESLNALATAIQEIMLDPNVNIEERLKEAEEEVLTRYWN
jgi:ABC-type glycerol-3-phosphate transport system substrate-binding protein